MVIQEAVLPIFGMCPCSSSSHAKQSNNFFHSLFSDFRFPLDDSHSFQSLNCNVCSFSPAIPPTTSASTSTFPLVFFDSLVSHLTICCQGEWRKKSKMSRRRRRKERR